MTSAADPASSPSSPSSPTQRRLFAVNAERASRAALVALWASLLLTAGPALATALDRSDRSLQVVASLGLWVAWVGTLVAVLLPRTVSLTAARILVPAAVPVLGWAVWAQPSGDDAATSLAIVGLGTTAAATVLVLSPFVGDLFVNGSSYGAERRLPLRPPGALLAGPVPLAWAVCVAGATAGPLLLAAGHWVPGGAATALGLPASAATARALHGLARRWLVFGPAGFGGHDPLTLTEPVLCTRRTVQRIGPAAAGTDATDLTAGALGLALQVDLSEPVDASRRSPAGTVELSSFLVAPSRPGVVLREARQRRLRVA
jgi:hypothetical protein